MSNRPRSSQTRSRASGEGRPVRSPNPLKKAPRNQPPCTHRGGDLALLEYSRGEFGEVAQPHRRKVVNVNVPEAAALGDAHVAHHEGVPAGRGRGYLVARPRTCRKALSSPGLVSAPERRRSRQPRSRISAFLIAGIASRMKMRVPYRYCSFAAARRDRYAQGSRVCCADCARFALMHFELRLWAPGVLGFLIGRVFCFCGLLNYR